MKGKMKITERALLQRLNRKLAGEDLIVKKTRAGRFAQELGEYFLLDFNHNRIVGKDVDLAAIGRERGVLQPWEIVGEL